MTNRRVSSRGLRTDARRNPLPGLCRRSQDEGQEVPIPPPRRCPQRGQSHASRAPRGACQAGPQGTMKRPGLGAVSTRGRELDDGTSASLTMLLSLGWVLMTCGHRSWPWDRIGSQQQAHTTGAWSGARGVTESPKEGQEPRIHGARDRGPAPGKATERGSTLYHRQSHSQGLRASLSKAIALKPPAEPWQVRLS